MALEFRHVAKFSILYLTWTSQNQKGFSVQLTVVAWHATTVNRTLLNFFCQKVTENYF